MVSEKMYELGKEIIPGFTMYICGGDAFHIYIKENYFLSINLFIISGAFLTPTTTPTAALLIR